MEWEQHQGTDYNCFQIDSHGTILESTLRKSGLVNNVIGFNVRDVLSAKEHAQFMTSVDTALKEYQLVTVDYHLQDQLYTAIIDPIDDETFYLHEHKTHTQEKDRIVAILMGFVRRRAG